MLPVYTWCQVPIIGPTDLFHFHQANLVISCHDQEGASTTAFVATANKAQAICYSYLPQLAVLVAMAFATSMAIASTAFATASTCYLLVPATCYTATCYLLLPATTCYYLLLPATACYLPPATCHLPPATCHLPPPPATCHLPILATSYLLLLPQLLLLVATCPSPSPPCASYDCSHYHY